MKKFKFILTGGLVVTSLLAHSQSDKKSTSKTDTNSKKTTKSAPTGDFKLSSKIDSISYSLGILISSNLKNQGFDALNADALAKAFTDTYNKTSKIDEKSAENIVMQYSQQMQQAKADKNLKEGQKFLAENKNKPGVVTTPSGLQYQVLKEGNGPKPAASDVVTVNYHGTLIDGTVFDSSVDRGQPATFNVNGVIQGWVEALQLMPVGSKWRLFIPSNLAYGEQGTRGAIGPNATLIFDVELLSIGQK